MKIVISREKNGPSHQAKTYNTASKRSSTANSDKQNKDKTNIEPRKNTKSPHNYERGLKCFRVPRSTSFFAKKEESSRRRDILRLFFGQFEYRRPLVNRRSFGLKADF